jgi:hypothetical protein
MDKKHTDIPIAQILNENYYPVKFNAEEKRALNFWKNSILIQNKEKGKFFHEFTNI